MVKLEKNIAMPPPLLRYPWHEAEVGDSFLFAGPSKQAHKRCGAMSKKCNKTFKARQMPDGTMRVWRIK